MIKMIKKINIIPYVNWRMKKNFLSNKILFFLLEKAVIAHNNDFMVKILNNSRILLVVAP